MQALHEEFFEVIPASSSTGVFAISVAAEMVSMEIQNLRVYERRGLLDPERTAGGTRLYSPDDIARLVRIRELLAEGLNLAGIAQVLALEAEVGRLQAANTRLRAGARVARRTRPPAASSDR
jgi:MerR family transcriptional regulator/heat shock protein HspR